MASTLGLIPTKGTTLPFLSYGGSSLIAASISLGFVLSLNRRRRLSTSGSASRRGATPSARACAG